jgi:hypothetical protein
MSKLTPRQSEFVGAVTDVAKEHGASSEFVLVKKRDLQRTIGETALAETEAGTKKTCILWGYDPETGQRICLRWG